MPEYGGVPPDPVIVTVVVCPLHKMDPELLPATSDGGCVRLNVAVAVQLFASVIVHVYIPAGVALRTFVLFAIGDHAYVYGPVPPEGETIMCPFPPPLQEILFCIWLGEMAEGCVMLMAIVLEQPVDSTTVYA